jgi:hypothetical protein
MKYFCVCHDFFRTVPFDDSVSYAIWVWHRGLQPFQVHEAAGADDAVVRGLFGAGAEAKAAQESHTPAQAKTDADASTLREIRRGDHEQAHPLQRPFLMLHPLLSPCRVAARLPRWSVAARTLDLAYRSWRQREGGIATQRRTVAQDFFISSSPLRSHDLPRFPCIATGSLANPHHQD